MGIYVNTFGTSTIPMSDGEIAETIKQIFDMRPFFIEQRLKLRNPIYSETASYGHMGRKPKTVIKNFNSPSGESKTVEVELFTWEKLDYVEIIRKKFKI